jgi:hypothetical protein
MILSVVWMIKVERGHTPFEEYLPLCVKYEK